MPPLCNRCKSGFTFKMTCYTNLSLLEDDEGARFARAGFGFRACGFGAGFSANGKK